MSRELIAWLEDHKTLLKTIANILNIGFVINFFFEINCTICMQKRMIFLRKLTAEEVKLMLYEHKQPFGRPVHAIIPPCHILRQKRKKYTKLSHFFFL